MAGWPSQWFACSMAGSMTAGYVNDWLARWMNEGTDGRMDRQIDRCTINVCARKKYQIYLYRFRNPQYNTIMIIKCYNKKCRALGPDVKEMRKVWHWRTLDYIVCWKRNVIWQRALQYQFYGYFKSVFFYLKFVHCLELMVMGSIRDLVPLQSLQNAQ